MEARLILVLRAEAEAEKRTALNWARRTKGHEEFGGAFHFGAKGGLKLGAEGKPERNGATTAFLNRVSVEGEKDREVIREGRARIRRRGRAIVG